MNVELVNPTSIYRLFTRAAAEPTRRPAWAPAWARMLGARLGEEIRYRQALHELRSLDDRVLDDINIARLDFPALARRHAKGLAPLGATL